MSISSRTPQLHCIVAPDRGGRYCSHHQLVTIRDSHMAYELEIDDAMLLFTVEEAIAYFAPRGAVRPDPEVLATRRVDDAPIRVRSTGARYAIRDLCVCICCPCDGGLVSMWLDSRDQKREERERVARAAAGAPTPAYNAP